MWGVDCAIGAVSLKNKALLDSNTVQALQSLVVGGGLVRGRNNTYSVERFPNPVAELTSRCYQAVIILVTEGFAIVGIIVTLVLNQRRENELVKMAGKSCQVG